MNFLEQRQLVNAIGEAARNGVAVALRVLKPAAVAPTTERRVPTFTHIAREVATPKPAAKVTAKTSPEPSTPQMAHSRREPPAVNPVLQAGRFAHLRAISQPADTLPRAVQMQAGPPAKELRHAAATLALAHGPIAPHASRPTEAALAAARKVMTSGQVARDAEAADRKAAASAVAARILAAGDGIHTRK